MRCRTEERETMPVYQKRFLEMQGYFVEVQLGSGAFGKVYRVWDTRKKCFWACKVACNREAREILRREAEIQNKITHPLFVRYETCLEHRDCTMLLMEYVEGENVEQYLHRGCMTQGQVVAVAIQLAEGIEYLHALPDAILYRDLKPENVCLTSNGRVRLMDLGCACRLSEARFSCAGSPGYAPKEQLSKPNLSNPMDSPGFYSDVYALGKLMHYMFTKDSPAMPPYRKPPIGAYNKKCSPFLEQIIMQCTEEEQKLRLPDMKCVLGKLRLLEAKGIGGRVERRKRELEAVAERVFYGAAESGFIYERNICCR